MLNTVPNHSTLILDGTTIKSIDYDVLETIMTFKEEAVKRGIEIQTINIQEIVLNLNNR